MNKRIVKNNIKNTLFFSYSIICSTAFFVIHLTLKNEHSSIENKIHNLKYSESQYENKIKSLRRQRNLLIESVEELAYEDYGFIIPDPEPLVIIMDNEERFFKEGIIAFNERRFYDAHEHWEEIWVNYKLKDAKLFKA